MLEFMEMDPKQLSTSEWFDGGKKQRLKTYMRSLDKLRNELRMLQDNHCMDRARRRV